MKQGFRICFHNSIPLSKELKEFLEGKVEHFCSENSYKERAKSAAFYRRGILGLTLGADFKTRSSNKGDIVYTFKRLSRNRRIFGVVPINELDGDIDLNQCMCAEHRGGQRVNLKNKYNESGYTTYFEIGDIKG